jgi:tRNA nucleotidyltransferase/poly(A) polymerase
MDFPLPAHIKKILSILTGRGFAAYVVGGAVRDRLLGRVPQDYDVATNATPREIGIAAREHDLKIIDKLGRLFGVTMLVVGENTVEVSTFRRESYGGDAHRPAKVVFCQTLGEDLARRDFTANAMAVGENGKLFDPYGGFRDIGQKCLRTVGDADKRFAEDGLRMFRACRFCAQLGFLPAPELLVGINKQKMRTHGLSLERVKAETEKLIVAAHPGIGLLMLAESGLAGEYCSFKAKGLRKTVGILPELPSAVASGKTANSGAGREEWLGVLTRVPAELILRWSALFYFLAANGRWREAPGREPPGCGKAAAAMAERTLGRFLYGNRFIRRASWLLCNYDKFTGCLRGNAGLLPDWLRAEAQSGYFRTNSDFVGAFSELLELSAALTEQHPGTRQDDDRFHRFSRQIAELAAATPVHTSDLAIGAADMDGYIPSGMTGVFLNRLLRKTQAGELANSRPELLEYLRRL